MSLLKEIKKLSVNEITISLKLIKKFYKKSSMFY